MIFCLMLSLIFELQVYVEMKKQNIDEKLRLLEEKKAAQLEKLTQLKNREKDLKAQQRKQQKELTRQQETRLKILLGAFYLRQFSEDKTVLESIKNDFIKFANEATGTAQKQNIEVINELFKQFKIEN